MWTAGFPEPLTFSLRAAPAAARPAAATSTSCTTTRRSATGCSASRRAGLPLVTTIHHPISVDRRVDLAAAAWLAAAARCAAGTASCACRAGSPAGCRDRAHRLASRSGARHRRRLRGRPERVARHPARRRHRRVPARPTPPRVPGRIVAMASADIADEGHRHAAARRSPSCAPSATSSCCWSRKPKPGGQTEQLRRPSWRSASAVRFVHGISDERAGRAGRLGRDRLRAVALRGLLAARRRGDGLRARPLVASRAGAIPEVVGRTGCAPTWSRPATSRSSRPRWRRCSTTPAARRRLGAAGRARGSLERFSLARGGRGDRRGVPAGDRRLDSTKETSHADR